MHIILLYNKNHEFEQGKCQRNIKVEEDGKTKVKRNKISTMSTIKLKYGKNKDEDNIKKKD